jgi:hypothetical protein
MPIGFSCGQCGKDYLVSDGLAGKRAVCKACGNRMVIPEGRVEPAAGPSYVEPRAQSAKARPASSSPRPAPARPDSPSTRVARESTRPARAAAPVPKARAVRTFEPPVADLYGLDEDPSPLPPIMPRASGGDGAEAAVSPVKKKKKKGFFSAGAKKKSSGGSSFFDGLGSSPLVLGIIAVVVIGGAIGGFSLLSKSQMESIVQQLIDLADDTTAALRPVQTPAQAAAVSSRVKENLRKMCDLLDNAKGKKGERTEVDEVTRKLGPRLQSACFGMGKEFGRLKTMPEVNAALGAMAEFQRMLALAQEAAESDGQARNRPGRPF